MGSAGWDTIVPHVVLLGDFNDEPFDRSLAEQVLATRDRGRARRGGCLLYNPFWRCLGEREPHVPGTVPRTYAGSYFHRRGASTQWRTFDQIIFSAPFLGDGGLRLDERHTAIVQTPPLIEMLTRRDSRFDHFPVVSAVERYGEDAGEP